MTPSQHAAGLRLLRNFAGCYFHPDSTKVLSPTKRSELYDLIRVSMKTFSITIDEVMMYADQSKIHVTCCDGKYLFGSSYNDNNS